VTLYSRILLHCIFSVKGKNPLIDPAWESSLYKKIGYLIKQEGCNLFAVNGAPDHIHVFFRLPSKKCLSLVIKSIKAKSSLWVNEKKFCSEKFEWQKGYGVESVSKDHFNRVYNYILNQ